MGFWPANTPTSWETAGAVTASSRGTALVSGGANTKGSWTQLVAATTADTREFVVALRMQSSGGHAILVDIGVGAAASETVIIPDLHVAGSATDIVYFSVPVFIPAGTRVSARAACSTATQTCYAMGYAQTAGLLTAPGPIVATYGAETADTSGISIDPGGAANTKGSWVQITASTTANIDAVLVNFGGGRNTTRTNCTWLVDVGTGAGGSEVVLLPNLYLGSPSGQEDINPMSMPPLLVPTVPLGTRLAVRAQCDTTDATDRLFDVILHASTASP